MLRNYRNSLCSPRSQRGMTLIELLVAGVISLIAVGGMVAVMANTLGTGAQTIKMSQLTQEMRTAMQIMSRELRRANFHGTYMNCFGNIECLSDLGITAKIGEINITDNGDSDCLWFWYQRPDTSLNLSQAGAFRRTTVGTIGKLQIFVPAVSPPPNPDCNSNNHWVDITDPELVDITAFNVNDAESVVETVNAAGDTQSVERIGLTITARLTPNASVPAWLQTANNPNAARQLQEFIKVRNHTTTAAASP